MTTTQQAIITNLAWVDLGIGPLEIQSTTSPITLVVSDLVPFTLTTPGFNIEYGGSPFQLNAATHIWAIALNSPAALIYVPISNSSTSNSTSTVNVGNFPTIQPVSGSLSVSNFPSFQRVDTVVQATSASRSGTITTGGTSQSLAAANASRRGFILQNQSSFDLYFNTITTATLDNNSFKLGAGETYESNSHHTGTGVISIIGSVTGQAFYAKEF